MKEIKPTYLTLLIIFLFVLRMVYGVVGEFWADDEQQIYLIGLKSYTTQTWPFYGPDVVYTNTQIPGALQGLLVSVGFYICPIPEAPALFLGLFSFLILFFFAKYLCVRFPDYPKWFIYTLTLTTPWVMQFSPRIVNPSYVMIFAIPFFIGFIEIIELFGKRILKKSWLFFTLGLATTCIMQLHLSWILLLPFTGYAFLHILLREKKELIKSGCLYVLGLAIGISTLIPTLLFPDPSGAGDVGNNIVFDWSNFKNLIPILTKYASFAAYEIPYMLGGDIDSRLKVLTEHWWMWWMLPVALFLFPFGLSQAGFFILSFFQKNKDAAWIKLKWILFFSYIMLFVSFFFSTKGPSPHTFIILFPLPFIYSLFCYRWIMQKYSWVSKLLVIAVIMGVFFQIGLGINSFEKKSVYKDRDRAVKAIEEKNYKILGTRRADHLGHGY